MRVEGLKSIAQTGEHSDPRRALEKKKSQLEHSRPQEWLPHPAGGLNAKFCPGTAQYYGKLDLQSSMAIEFGTLSANNMFRGSSLWISGSCRKSKCPFAQTTIIFSNNSDKRFFAALLSLQGP
ncbi:hypothetical protein GX48_00480 [Paracoccidioides brasiliensis]|nr:hypothetical protein GX48_00480 [Paracoccidioides brasiliensis]